MGLYDGFKKLFAKAAEVLTGDTIVQFDGFTVAVTDRAKWIGDFAITVRLDDHKKLAKITEGLYGRLQGELGDDHLLPNWPASSFKNGKIAFYTGREGYKIGKEEMVGIIEKIRDSWAKTTGAPSHFSEDTPAPGAKEESAEPVRNTAEIAFGKGVTVRIEREGERAEVSFESKTDNTLNVLDVMDIVMEPLYRKGYDLRLKSFGGRTLIVDNADDELIGIIEGLAAKQAKRSDQGQAGHTSTEDEPKGLSNREAGVLMARLGGIKTPFGLPKTKIADAIGGLIAEDEISTEQVRAKLEEALEGFGSATISTVTERVMGFLNERGQERSRA